MSCALTQNFTLDCINSKGGIKIMYVGVLSELAAVPTIVAGAVTAMAMATTKKMWTYNLEKQNAVFSQSLQKNLETGTKFYNLKYDWNKKKMDVASQNELDLLAENRLFAIHLDNNGNYWVGGLENALDLMSNEGGSGKQFSELNGYVLGFTGEEPKPVYAIAKAIVDVLIVAAV